MATQGMNNGRTQANTSERILTPTNVNQAQFGKLGDWTVDGAVWGQLLFEPSVHVAGGTKDLLIVCTMHNTCYGFDANVPGSSPVWQTNFGPPQLSYPQQDTNLYGAEVGVLSTPVIDEPAGKLYVTHATAAHTWVLSQLSLASGAILNSVTITGSVPGTGDLLMNYLDAVSGGTLSFLPSYQLQRPALLLANNNVYIAFGSYADIDPFHGWIFAYSTANLTPASVFCTNPNGGGGGIWQSGRGLASDPSGNVYAVTGNGNSYDGMRDFSESVIKLNPTLSVLDYFTPSNWAEMDAGDWDLGSNGPMLVPGTSLVIAAGKDKRIFGIDSNNMGHLQGPIPNPQILQTNDVWGIEGPWGGTAFINNRLYISNTFGGAIYSYGFSGTTFGTTPTVSASGYPYPGAQLFATSNGASNTLIFALTPNLTVADPPTICALCDDPGLTGTLRVFDGTTLVELFNAPAGHVTKFLPPTVVNGRAYITGRDRRVSVFGLLPADGVVPRLTSTTVVQQSAQYGVSAWYLGGPQATIVQSVVPLAPSTPGWKVVGFTDLDRDGNPDLVWQSDSTREVVVQFSNGQANTFPTSGRIADAIPGWTVVGFADFNNDGAPDVIWQNDATREVWVWYLGGPNGNDYLSSAQITGPMLGWRLAGVADFNADGHPDVAWQNDDTRDVWVSYLGGPKGVTYLATNNVASNMTGWRLAGLADCDADGHPDLLWENDNDLSVWVWYLTGPSGNEFKATNPIILGTSGWSVKASR